MVTRLSKLHVYFFLFHFSLNLISILAELYIWIAQTVVLKVHMNCQGCMNKVKKVLRKIEGKSLNFTIFNFYGYL